jgi:cleavage and polyadenylation specificity factor subunit 3
MRIIKLYFLLISLSSFNVVTLSPHSHSHSHVHADQDDEELMQQYQYERLAAFLESHFGDATIYLPEEDMKDPKDAKPGEERDQPAIIVRVDDATARVNLVDLVSPKFRAYVPY